MNSAVTGSKGTRLMEEYLDKPIFVVMRDGKYMVGTLRSYDQYYNILLEDSTEYTTSSTEYSSIDSESVLLRGENIVLLGEGTFSHEEMEKVPEITEKVKTNDDLDYIAL
ncbi:U6 snRNA-associated Sm-like protein LSm1 [Nematocida ausubeli]|nr:U6 snRNA-associated Sm-like protein LSm1 [Nematocida ausubeli]